MTRLILAALFALALTGCPSESADECPSFIWEFTCEDGSCSCDDDGTPCTDPDEADIYTTDSCEDECIECTE
ncbi:MAG: hypothetical protein KDA24_25650 [Deltaproteobacteria bacterium]|nr:hypothetical protein [Deltaproteobacteria bacterium]